MESKLLKGLDNSFSLRKNGQWHGSKDLIKKVETIRGESPAPLNKACTHTGWGDSGGSCTHTGWSS
jgi:hypothetical protein